MVCVILLHPFIPHFSLVNLLILQLVTPSLFMSILSSLSHNLHPVTGCSLLMSALELFQVWPDEYLWNFISSFGISSVTILSASSTLASIMVLFLFLSTAKLSRCRLKKGIVLISKIGGQSPFSMWITNLLLG